MRRCSASPTSPIPPRPSSWGWATQGPRAGRAPGPQQLSHRRAALSRHLAGLWFPLVRAAEAAPCRIGMRSAAAAARVRHSRHAGRLDTDAVKPGRSRARAAGAAHLSRPEALVRRQGRSHRADAHPWHERAHRQRGQSPGAPARRLSRQEQGDPALSLAAGALLERGGGQYQLATHPLYDRAAAPGPAHGRDREATPPRASVRRCWRRCAASGARRPDGIVQFRASPALAAAEIPSPATGRAMGRSRPTARSTSPTRRC